MVDMNPHMLSHTRSILLLKLTPHSLPLIPAALTLRIRMCAAYTLKTIPAPQVQFCNSSLTSKDIAPFFKMNHVSPFFFDFKHL